MKIELKSRWIYIGPGDGRGQVHTVLAILSDEVITWGQPMLVQEFGGFSWMGSVGEFLSCFKPVPLAMIPPKPFVL